MPIPLNETNPDKRKVPLYMVNGVLAPLLALTFTGSQISVSKAGGALTAFAGSYEETGNGHYDYEHPPTEVNVQGFLLTLVNHPSALRYIWVDQVGNSPAVNEPVATNRRIPIYLVDTNNNNPVTGLTFSGAEVQLSKAGGVWVNATGSVVEVSSGVYYYQGVIGDYDTAGPLKLKINKAGAQPYSFDVAVGLSAGGSGDSVPPTITIINPPPGTVIGPSTPIVFRYTDESGLRRPMPMMKFLQADDGTGPKYKYELIHNGDAFTPDYSGTFVQLSPTEYEYTINRRGGWTATLPYIGGSPTLVPFGTDTGGNEPT